MPQHAYEDVLCNVEDAVILHTYIDMTQAYAIYCASNRPYQIDCVFVT